MGWSDGMVGWGICTFFDFFSSFLSMEDDTTTRHGTHHGLRRSWMDRLALREASLLFNTHILDVTISECESSLSLTDAWVGKDLGH